MILKITKKIFIILIILMMLSFEMVNYAAININKAHLVKIGEADYHLKYYREDRDVYTYLKCSIVGYYDNNNFYPAYCMNRDLPGAEEGEYDVDIGEVLKNDKVWRIVKNGYPYKTYQEMGLSSEYDAFCVTKMAIYCVLGQANLDYFIADEQDVIGINMLNALKQLVDIGINGNEQQEKQYLSLEKNGDLIKQESIYLQKYKINELVETESEYEINIQNSNINIRKIDKTNFEVLIPEQLISNDIEIIFNIGAKVKNYPILYGKTTMAGTQDYVITAKKSSSIIENFKSKINTNNSKIEILKKDSETKEPIEKTKFELYDQNMKLIDSKETDWDGKIVFENLYKGKYILKEVEANTNYIINEKEVYIDLQYNEIKKIELENEHKKGSLKVIKYDKDDPKITLGGIEFELFDEKNILVGKYTTDLNGEIKIENLNIGKYYLREVMSKNGYEISEDIFLEIKYNEITNIEISNEKTKGKVKVIKVDKDDNNIKLKGVEFVILDEKSNIVDKLITDENGEAESKLLPIYKENYYLKEIKTNEEYILDENIIEIKLDSNIVDTKIIKNEVKKGKIKILKLDYDEFTPIENVEFNIINLKTGQIIEKIKTNKLGEAVTQDLPINCEYKIVEDKALEGYIKNEEEVIVKPKFNQEVLVTMTNEKQKGRVKIIKVDKDDENIKLSGVKFELYNKDKLLEVIETNEKGEAYSKWLYSYNEKYYLIEILGEQGYKINKDKIEFELLANKTIDLIIKNEKEKVKIEEEKTEEIVEVKKLPRTGY